MSIFTILGANGFIGSHLAERLTTNGHKVHRLRRGDPNPDHAGHVIFCIGLTSDFRSRPLDTVEAHVGALHDFLRALHFDSFTYLSSTRVYQHLPSGELAREDAILAVNPNDPSDLYNISKIMGESLCLSNPNPAVRAVRLSNVYGRADRSENFLSSILRDALTVGTVQLQIPLDSSKDYIAIDDVVDCLERIPERAKSRLINLAVGRNVSNEFLADLLHKHTGSVLLTDQKTGGVIFPPIDVERLRQEIGIVPTSLEANFFKIVAEFRSDMGMAPQPTSTSPPGSSP